MHSKNTTLIILIIYIATLTNAITVIASEQELNSIPEYDEGSFKKESDGLRRRFLTNKIENEKARFIDQLSNDTIYVDGIPHFYIRNGKSQRNKMETAFKSLLGMKGIKYTFRRGFHWRTWREIEKEGNKTLICYTCTGSMNTTCKGCFNSGYWIIEDKPPPCPYEILSMPNENQICSIHFTQYNNIPSLCPTLININDLLSTCNNPIETDYKITRKYNDETSAPTLDVICKGRASCRISTYYTVLPDSILFRIVNSSSHIIYSRVMKTGHKNYICVDNCGIMDKITKTVAKNDSPLILNLLKTNEISHKNKREYNSSNNKTNNVHKVTTKVSNSLVFRTRNMKNALKNLSEIAKKSFRTTSRPVLGQKKLFTKSLCKKLLEAYTEENSDTVEV
ncbi:uncharacterized protein [Battus philenor]|uniref:uncharacterized protein n=1 Tax=Battus philenor TaxID=42288 RepID=UPI0035CEC257